MLLVKMKMRIILTLSNRRFLSAVKKRKCYINIYEPIKIYISIDSHPIIFV